jgi:hypothetical protein
LDGFQTVLSFKIRTLIFGAKSRFSAKINRFSPGQRNDSRARSGIAILQLNLLICNPIENQALAAG